MTGYLQVAAKPVPGDVPAGKLVIHHGCVEDFSVYQPAGLLLRAYALTFDIFLSTPLDVLVHLPFHRYLERMAAYGYGGRHLALTAVLAAIPLIAYFYGPTMIFGQTLGKKIVGIRVLTTHCDAHLSPFAILVREMVGKPLSLASFGLGFVMAGFTGRKRALHDFLAGTIVVSFRER